MLKQRVITALILAPLALWGIWALPSSGFAAALGVLFAMAGWEWSRLCGLERAPGRALYVAVLVLAMVGGYPLLAQGNWALVILVLALMWWTLALLAVVSYPQGTGLWQHSGTARGIAGLLVLLPAWAALALMHARFGAGYVILLMVMIWGADTGAYFAGRAFGRHKLSPRVSPGKSWEGVAGGALLAVLVALLGTVWVEPVGGYGMFLPLVLLTVMISVLGDLMESLFKRMADVKDSGGLLPGHGGVMDRIDSLTAAGPLFALGLLWLSR
jgi:phosphatidate cytidylyltransferase